MEKKISPQLEIQEERTKILSTLLIPDECWDLFEKYKAALNKTTAELLEYLLESFQEGKNTEFARQNRLTVHYQDQGLCLKKHNFLVGSLVWHRFKCLARFYGLSVCRLFSFLLLALGSLGTPKNQNFILLVKLFERVDIPYKTAIRMYKVQPQPDIQVKAIE